MSKKAHAKVNALKASLRTPLFRQRVEKKQKGKGSYTRKGKGAQYPKAA